MNVVACARAVLGVLCTLVLPPAAAADRDDVPASLRAEALRQATFRGPGLPLRQITLADGRWLGGFARFCPEDTTPPSAPWNLQSSTAGSGVTLTWNASTDASGTVSYDVYRDDRVIATVWGRSYTDPEVDGTHTYTVRATDARGNRSASPAP